MKRIGSIDRRGDEASMRARPVRRWSGAAARPLLLAIGALSAGAAAQAPGAGIVQCLSRKPDRVWHLPPLFREESGLALSADGRLFLHNDEQGIVAAFDYQRGQVLATYALGPGTPRGDFEGIAIAGERLFLTTSDGDLYETRVPGAGLADRSTLPFRVTATGLGRLCEIEGLAYEPAGDVLLFACKLARKKSLRHQVTIFRWSLAQARLAVPDRITVPIEAVTRAGAGFHPSALERDSRTGRYVLVAARERAVAELDPGGRVVATGQLGGHHRQAEGLAIVGDGTVIVSDEGGRHPGKVTTYACR